MSRISSIALHGFTGGPSSFTALALEDCWTPYLAGHGPCPSFEVRSFQDQLEHLETQIALKTEGRPVHLLGYSMGARVALGLLLRSPGRYSGVSLLSVNPGLESEHAIKERFDWEHRWIDVLQLYGLKHFIEKWEALPLFREQEVLSPEVLKVQRAQRMCHTQAGLAHCLKVLGLAKMPNFWPLLKNIQVPVSLIVGANDLKFKSLAERTLPLSPHIRLSILDGVGHNPLLEAPDRLRQLIEKDLGKSHGKS